MGLKSKTQSPPVLNEDCRRGTGNLRKVPSNSVRESGNAIILSIFQLTFQKWADMCMKYNCIIVPKTIEKLWHTLIHARIDRYLNCNYYSPQTNLLGFEKPWKLCRKKKRSLKWKSLVAFLHFHVSRRIPEHFWGYCYPEKSNRAKTQLSSPLLLTCDSKYCCFYSLLVRYNQVNWGTEQQP